MLKLRYLFENYDLARAALENWPHDEEGLDGMLERFRISSNAIYPFKNGGRVFFLRLAPTEEKRARNLRGELELVTALERADYPALRPVPARNGETLLTLHTQWGDWYASVFTCVPGVPLEDTDCPPAAMRAAGAALGRLHTLTRRFVPQTRKWAHEDALAWIGETLRAENAPSCMERERAEVAAELAALPRDAAVYGLVHYDFELDNVFWDAQTGTCHVIDFEDGMEHWYALDLEQALDSLAEELPEERLRAACAAFMEGYRAESPWTAEQERTRPLMRRFCDLYAYARIRRSAAERLGDEPDWMTSVRGKLDARMAEVERRVRARQGNTEQ